MPDMPLLQSDGTLDSCTVGIVQACMMYPDDPASIEEDISAYRMRAETGFRDTQLGRRMNEEFRKARLGGQYAGAILFSLIQFTRFRPELKISFNKAAHLTAVTMSEEHSRYSKNISTVKGYWSQYKNAAHLWAALMLVFGDDGPPINFVSVVTIAERLAEEAAPMLADWSPWRTPSGFQPDASFALIEEPRPEDVKRVQAYKANAK